ncbi:sulfurtransferase complex subunit TusD [Pseudomonas sp. S9]|uniref:sulfurtransferase complex subunit TusD n=1 Tax=Pseudomonas sp. S9 TaxID=686578 RepID=UPI0002556BEA|nr:sulfurtransferase complex subunit TusD [Pseudomonas sp. S9]
MKFAIALFAAPHQPSSRRALRFAQAAIAQGHEIVRLFFYQDGVYNASSAAVSGQDEIDLPSQWREFVDQHQLDGVVCIAAALRRGALNDEEAARYSRTAASVQAPWQLSGLGQLHEANQIADRLICFGGA